MGWVVKATTRGGVTLYEVGHADRRTAEAAVRAVFGGNALKSYDRRGPKKEPHSVDTVRKCGRRPIRGSADKPTNRSFRCIMISIPLGSVPWQVCNSRLRAMPYRVCSVFPTSDGTSLCSGHSTYRGGPLLTSKSTLLRRPYSTMPGHGASKFVAGLRVVVPVLPVGLVGDEPIAHQRALVDQLLRAISPQRVITWYYTPLALQFTRHVRSDLCVYDNMDELSAFKGASPELLTLESELLSLADVVFTRGHSIYEAKRRRHQNIHPFPSSIDFAHFAAARDHTRPEPSDQSGLRRPRLGFFGVIDERMDLALVAGLADLRPSWDIVMIGPVVKIDAATLPLRPNLHWIGARHYTELPAYLRGWDVGIMPFALNDATRFISPTKTPEFLAAGVPVVSTAISDVIHPYEDLGSSRLSRRRRRWRTGLPIACPGRRNRGNLKSIASSHKTLGTGLGRACVT